jgi:hypothetical protein
MGKSYTITKYEELALPADQQAAIACSLMSSLEPGIAQGNEHAWLEEAGRRYEAYQRGETTGRPAEQIIEEVKIKY